jgi:glycine cleavage system H protein
MTIKFTKDHEWIKIDGETASFGITQYAADQLGDVVYVEVPEVGKSVKAGEAIAVVESVKAASDVYAPIDCEIIEGNDELSTAPEIVNASANEDGWFAKVKILDASQLEELMDQAAYNEYLSGL